jgi:hypothetical protein
MEKTRRLGKISLLVVGILLLTVPLVSAALSDSFVRVFTKIDTFFTAQAYKPYAKTIDFFFFTLFFIAIYLQVIKYAFKENTRTVKFIAILLGFMSGFLLTAGRYSIQKLIPYIPWLIFFLVAAFFYRLFTGFEWPKGKFARLLLSFLLAFLTVWLVSQWLFPKGQVDFFDNLGRIELPSLPAVPTPGTSLPSPGFGQGNANVPVVTKEKGFFDKLWDSAGVVGSAWPLLLGLLALLLGGFAGRAWWRRRGGGGAPAPASPPPAPAAPSAPATLEGIAQRLDDLGREVMDSFNKLRKAKIEKEFLLQSESKQMLLGMLKDDKNRASIYTDEGRFALKEEHGNLAKLLEKENQFSDAIVRMFQKQKEVFDMLAECERRFPQSRNVARYVQYLRRLITQKPTIDSSTGKFNVRNAGIVPLLRLLAGGVQKDKQIEEELEDLVDEKKIVKLVQEKFDLVRQREQFLEEHNKEESFIISIVLMERVTNEKLALQALAVVVKNETQRAVGQQVQRQGTQESAVQTQERGKEHVAGVAGVAAGGEGYLALNSTTHPIVDAWQKGESAAAIIEHLSLGEKEKALLLKLDTHLTRNEDEKAGEALEQLKNVMHYSLYQAILPIVLRQLKR